MEEKDMQQETQVEENNSFLDEWEDDGPAQEEAATGGGGGKTAPAQEDGQGAEGKPPAGEAGAAPAGGTGGEGFPTAGGSGGQPAGAAQPGTGGSGGNVQGEDQQDAGQQPPPPPRTWTVPHMGREITVTEADIPALTQRALAYDGLRASYDEARPVMELFRGFAKQAGMSVQEYVGRLRTQAKQMEGLDEAAARRAVEMEDREARVSMQEAQERARQEAFQRSQTAQRQRQERVNADIQEFISVFPDAARDFQSIPQEVWDAVNGGMSLVAAYARHIQSSAAAQAQSAAEQQQRQEAVRQQNARNAAASTGSMRSAGSPTPQDPLLAEWDED